MADFTSTVVEKELEAKGNIRDATNLLGSSVNEAGCGEELVRAAGAASWVDVENGNILKELMRCPRSSPASCRSRRPRMVADSNIAQTLNES